jgi:hypothetical protein
VFKLTCNKRSNCYSFHSFIHKAKQSCYMPWWRLGEEEYSSYSFLTSALGGGEWSASRPGRALPQGKYLWYPLYRRLGGPQSGSVHRGQRKNPLPLPGIEPRSPGRPARSQTLYCLSYPAPYFYFIHSQALIVQDGPLASLSGFLDLTHTDTR